MHRYYIQYYLRLLYIAVHASVELGYCRYLQFKKLGSSTNFQNHNTESGAAQIPMLSLFYERAENLRTGHSMYLFTFLSTSLSSYSPRAYKFIMPRGVVGYASARMRRSMLSHWWITAIYSNGFKSFFPIHRPENHLFN